MRGSLYGLCGTSLSQLHTCGSELACRWHSTCRVPLPEAVLWPRGRGRGTASSHCTITTTLPPRLCPLQRQRTQRSTSVHRHDLSRSCCSPADHSRYALMNTAATTNNKMSPWRDVTLLARRVLPSGELRCAMECCSRRQTMTMHQRALLVWPPYTMCKWANNNNSNRDDIYGAVIMVKPLRELTQFIWWMQTQRQLAANPQTKPTNLDCDSSRKSIYHLHPPSPCIITQPESYER